MQITVKEAKFLKEGSGGKSGSWKLYKVVDDKNNEYTTFDTKAASLNPGAVIDIGDPIMKDNKLSFKEVVQVISSGTATALATPTPENGKNGMTPAQWEKKDLRDRVSFEAQTAFKGIVGMVSTIFGAEGKEIPGPLYASYEKALKWADSKLAPAPDQALSEQLKKMPSVGDKTEGKASPALPFKNAGEFYTACLKTYRLNKSLVDAEIVGKDLSDPKQRAEAWGSISMVHGVKANEENTTKAEDTIDPEELKFD